MKARLGAVSHNLAATTASRIYLTIAALLALPVYLRTMGPEAYGLVTLFLVLQVWLQMLDLGAAATVARETARHRAGERSARQIRELLRAAETLFALVACVAASVLFALSGALVDGWLEREQLPAATVHDCLRLMTLCILLRLLGDLYRGALSGAERLAWLAGSNALFGTLRLLGVIPFLLWAGPDPAHFFGFLLTIYIFEAVVVRAQAWRQIPPVANTMTGISLRPLREVLGFSLSMTVATIVWSLTSQADKLVLSGLLSLRDFGAYGLAITAAGSVLILATALADTLVPRFTALEARGAAAALRILYRQATQGATIIAASTAFWLACHAERILWVWTGDAELARSTAPVLALYALGNAAMAIAAYPYYLQLARGQLRLHLIGTGLTFVVLLLAVAWVAPRHGAVGAAMVWLLVNGLYLLAWTPIAHKRFAPGLHWRWLRSDVAPVVLAAAAAALVTSMLSWPVNRVVTALLLLPTAAVILGASSMGSSWARAAVRRRGLSV